MGWAFSTYRGEERFIHSFIGIPERKRPLGRQMRRGGGIILIWIFRKWDGVHGLI